MGRRAAKNLYISIHALREEGDMCLVPLLLTPYYFYPRPPRGGRHVAALSMFWSLKFLSTPSARRATACCQSLTLQLLISIHALREEGDSLPL